MDLNLIECEFAERDPGMCECKEGPTLDILKDIQRAYENRMEVIERVGGSKKLQMQVDTLRSWVSDLVGQNTLLARAVEDLETEATTRLLLERRRNSEIVSELNVERNALRRRLARKDSDLRGLVEVLRRLREFDHCTLDGIHFFEVTESDIFGPTEWHQGKLDQGDCRHRNFKLDSIRKGNKEIQKLNKDMQQYEQTIMNLRSELSLNKYHTPDATMKDAEVMAGMCCTGTECGDWEPVKDITALIREETLKYQERLQKMEENLKSSSKSVLALRKANIVLNEETQAMRRMCLALDEQSRAANTRAQFKDDIIKEIRRQLKQAKARVHEAEFNNVDWPKSMGDYARVQDLGSSLDAGTTQCVQVQPRRNFSPRELESDPNSRRSTNEAAEKPT